MLVTSKPAPAIFLSSNAFSKSKLGKRLFNVFHQACKYDTKGLTMYICFQIVNDCPINCLL